MTPEPSRATVFDHRPSQRLDPDVPLREPPVITQQPTIIERPVHGPIGREIQATFGIKRKDQGDETHPIMRKPIHATDSTQQEGGMMAVIDRMRWNGDVVIDREGPDGSWRMWMSNADRVFIVEGMTDTAMLDLARQINRTVKESKKKETE